MGSQTIAANAFTAAVPVVVENVERAVESPSGAETLHSLTMQFSRSARTGPQDLLGAVDHPLGKLAVERIFGSEFSAVSNAVASDAGIGNADRLIQNTSLACLAVAAGSGHAPNDLATFVAAATAASASSPSSRSGSASSTPSTPPPPPPATDAAAPAAVAGAALVAPAAGADPLMAPPAGAPAPLAPPVGPPADVAAADDEKPKRRMALLIGAIATFLLGGFLIGRVLGDDSDSKIATIADASIPVSSSTGAPDEPNGDAGVSSDSGGEVADDDAVGGELPIEEVPGDDVPNEDMPAEDVTAEEVVAEEASVEEASTAVAVDLASLETDPDVVAFAVPMRDIQDPSRDASGAIDLRLNTVTGEICFGVTSEGMSGPLAAHIHAGDFGVKGGIVADLGLVDNGDTGCIANLPVDTNAILAKQSGHYAELHEPGDEWTIRGQLSERIDGDIVSLSVRMVDAKSIAPDAEGIIDFAFNTTTGEICYSVSSEGVGGPYASHIHVGAVGVKGGIVVELGQLSDGDAACVDNLPVDTNAILADPANHYAELHDVGEVWTVRGQLSETIVDAPGTSGSSPAPDVPAATVDTDGGGARIELEQGTIYLRGDVADQATADQLRGALDGVGDVPVVDELVVVAGAPLPSGRIVIADAIFFAPDSSDVGLIDGDTVSAIVALVASQPDSLLTVVGHTDDRGSDVENLELSLRRATAVRDLLANLGLQDDRFLIRGAGETAPIGDNATPEGRAQNRRIEFELTPG